MFEFLLRPSQAQVLRSNRLATAILIAGFRWRSLTLLRIKPKAWANTGSQYIGRKSKYNNTTTNKDDDYDDDKKKKHITENNNNNTHDS